MQERRLLGKGATENWLIRFERKKPARFLIVLIAVGFATLIRFPLEPFIGDASPFFFYFPVVFVISAAFGFKPGSFATILSLGLANYFWMPPAFRFSINTGQSLEMIAFLFAGCCLAWLGEALQKQRHLKENLRAIVASVGEAIISIDSDARIFFLNPMAQMLTGLQSEDVIGKKLGGVFDLLGEIDHQPLNAQFENALRNDEIEKLPSRLIIVSKSGIQHRVEQKTSRILDSQGKRLGAVILLHDSGSLQPQLEPAS